MIMNIMHTISNEVLHEVNPYNSIIKTKDKYFDTFSGTNINIYNLNPSHFYLTPEKTITCNDSINNLDFNPDYPEIILSALYDGIVKLWNISNKENKNEICSFKGHNSSVKFALFNPKVNTIIISTDKNNIKLWDINEYSHEYNIIHKNNIEKLKWDFSGDKFGYINRRYELLINKRKNHKDLFLIKDQKLLINDFIFKGE
jgi:WD40 repeat protein